MPAQRVKIASYWSGLQKANSLGEATFNVDVPAFSGELRLMAVAFNNASFGSAETTMKVADPLVLKHCSSQVDEPWRYRGSSCNTNEYDQYNISSAATLQAMGPLSVVGMSEEKISTPAGKESVVSYKLIAGKAIGTGKMVLKVNAGKESYEESIDMSVRPAVPNQVRSGNGIIHGAAQTSINIPMEGFIHPGLLPTCYWPIPGC